MKFKVQMKDPDGVQDSLDDAAKEYANAISGLTDDEREAVQEKRREHIGSIAAQWFEWGEYLTVEIDTDAKTIRVCDATE